jgi:hypothetical protein
LGTVNICCNREAACEASGSGIFIGPPARSEHADLAADPTIEVASRAEALRALYRPASIKALFVGKSAPAGVRFFRAANSQVHRYLIEALAPHLGGDAFLDRFREVGLLLDDLVLTPVNHLNARERAARNPKAIPSLVARLTTYRPGAVVGVAKRIAAPLSQAHAGPVGMPSARRCIPRDLTAGELPERAHRHTVQPALARTRLAPFVASRFCFPKNRASQPSP